MRLVPPARTPLTLHARTTLGFRGTQAGVASGPVVSNAFLRLLLAEAEEAGPGSASEFAQSLKSSGLAASDGSSPMGSAVALSSLNRSLSDLCSNMKSATWNVKSWRAFPAAHMAGVEGDPIEMAEELGPVVTDRNDRGFPVAGVVMRRYQAVSSQAMEGLDQSVAATVLPCWLVLDASYASSEPPVGPVQPPTDAAALASAASRGLVPLSLRSGGEVGWQGGGLGRGGSGGETSEQGGVSAVSEEETRQGSSGGGGSRADDGEDFDTERIVIHLER